MGLKRETHFEKEVQIGVIFPKTFGSKSTVSALFKLHSYEEVAYEITTLENINQHIGMGMIGELASEMQPLPTF